MTLDASGNLGVGTTSPSRNIVAYGSTSAILALQNATTGTTSSDGFQIQASLGEAYVWNYENNFMAFGTNNTERARITAGGYFKASNSGAYGDSTGAYHELYQTAAGTQCAIFRSSSGSYTSTVLTLQCDRNTTDATYNFFSASVPGVGTRLVIADSGNVTNVNGSYGTISDAKMKTDIVDAGSQWADIKAIRFRKFKMKNDPSGLVQLGVVAQEVELTSPGLVDEHQDRDAEGNDLGTTTKSVKTSVLLMKAAVALQEAMARIETLEAKIAALEAK
jgi:hypothetical protein